HDLVGRHEQEFGLRVDEFADQPRSGDPVYLHFLARHPLHAEFSFLCLTMPGAGSAAWLAPPARDADGRVHRQPSPHLPHAARRSSASQALRMDSFSLAGMPAASTTSMRRLKLPT